MLLILILAICSSVKAGAVADLVAAHCSPPDPNDVVFISVTVDQPTSTTAPNGVRKMMLFNDNSLIVVNCTADGSNIMTTLSTVAKTCEFGSDDICDFGGLQVTLHGFSSLTTHTHQPTYTSQASTNNVEGMEEADQTNGAAKRGWW